MSNDARAPQPKAIVVACKGEPNWFYVAEYDAERDCYVTLDRPAADHTARALDLAALVEAASQ